MEQDLQNLIYQKSVKSLQQNVSKQIHQWSLNMKSGNQEHPRNSLNFHDSINMNANNTSEITVGQDPELSQQL